MDRVRLRGLLVASGAVMALAGVVLAVWLWPSGRVATDGCRNYPLFRQVWVCGDSVFLIVRGRREFMGRVVDLAPMPKPPDRSH